MDSEALVELNNETEARLRERLAELSAGANAGNITVSKPEKWLEIARLVMKGMAIRKVCAATHSSMTTVCRIRNEVFGSVEAYRKAVAEAITVNVDLIDIIKTKEFERMVEDSEEGKSLPEGKIRSLKDLSVIQTMDSARASKMLGEADVKVEHKFEKVDFEARKKELLAMRRAESVDVESEDVD